MKTIAALSLFSLASAVAFTPAAARAEGPEVAFANSYPPGFSPQPEVAPQQPIEAPRPQPPQFPEPYQPPVDPNSPNSPDAPNAGANDAGQVDWPQDLAPEEAAVDGYDDGYDPQAYADFQDELSPYGDWVDDASYGRVWVPEVSLVGADFAPYYTGGHWVLTEFGWTWVSDWSWGWAPFHYGRWIVSSHGWCWVPGRIWGPAWVSWRSGGGWVGWAALPPRGVSVAVTYGPRSPWRFSRLGDLGAPRPRCVPMRDMPGMFHRTTLVANDRVLTRGAATVHINAGPRYVPNARPARLMAVAPQAFPQRAIWPQRGVNMADRPWIRAAAGGGIGPGARGGAGAAVGAGRTPGRGVPMPAPRAPSPAPPPRIYNPPRAFASTMAPRAFGAAAPTPAAAAQPHGYGRAPVYGSPHASGAPPAANAPHVYNPPRAFNNNDTYGAAPRTYGAPPASDLPRVYSPPSRPFAQPAAPRPPPVQSFRPASAPLPPAPAPAHFAPPHNFSAPAPSFGGGFGHAGGGGGGVHVGGGHRR